MSDDLRDYRVIGNEIIDICRERDYYLSILPLMKFIYFAHGLHMGFHGLERPLVKAEFQAWKLGPVAPEAYRAYTDLGLVKRTHAELPEGTDRTLTKDGKETIRYTFERYKDYAAYELVDLAHGRQTPWYKYRYDLFSVIPDDETHDYYRRLVEHNGLAKTNA